MLPALLAMSKRYSERPSVILGVEDTYTAYCLDEACMYALCKLEEIGRLPDSLLPKSSATAVSQMKSMKGVTFIDYRRNGGCLSDP